MFLYVPSFSRAAAAVLRDAVKEADDFATIAAAVALITGVGGKPSIRRVAAVIAAANGKRALRWTTIAAALKVLPGNTSGNTPATVGQQNDEEAATPRHTPATATCAPADLKGLGKESGEYQDSPPSLTLTAFAPETRSPQTLPGLDVSSEPSDARLADVVAIETTRAKKASKPRSSPSPLTLRTWHLRDKVLWPLCREAVGGTFTQEYWRQINATAIAALAGGVCTDAEIIAAYHRTSARIGPVHMVRLIFDELTPRDNRRPNRPWESSPGPKAAMLTRESLLL